MHDITGVSTGVLISEWGVLISGSQSLHTSVIFRTAITVLFMDQCVLISRCPDWSGFNVLYPLCNSLSYKTHVSESMVVLSI